jgi:formate dehydrogenase subunit gamma
MSAVHVGAVGTSNGHAAGPGVLRYTFAERLVHWLVALSFIALMLSGFALGYPRAYFLSGLFGGGQTMRFLHPWFGVAFTLGLLWMLVKWARDMRFNATDRQWTRRLKVYSSSGHSGLDTGRYNAGQKGYYWISILGGVVLFLTGLPLWYPWMFGNDFNQAVRIVHHATFLLMVGGFIIHVYLSTVAFPGTLAAMTTGRVSRAWAAFHHPAWFRDHDYRRGVDVHR